MKLAKQILINYLSVALMFVQMQAVFAQTVRSKNTAPETALMLVKNPQDRPAAGVSYERVPVEELVYERFGKSPDPAVRAQVAQGMFNSGIDLGRAGKHAASQAAYDLVFTRFGDDNSLAVLNLVLKSLVNKGFDLGETKAYAKERAVYALIEERYGTSNVQAVRERLADALFNTGVSYKKSGDLAQALATYSSLDARFGADPSPYLCAMVAVALINQSVILVATDLPKSIALSIEVEKRYGADLDFKVRSQVAQAKVNKAIGLQTQTQYALALATYNEVIALYSKDKYEDTRVEVARAYYGKGISLGSLKRTQDAIANYTAVFERYGKSINNLEIARTVAHSLYNKALLQTQAKQIEAAIATYVQLGDAVDDRNDPELMLTLAQSAVNLGASYAEFDKHTLAIEAYDTAINLTRRSRQSEARESLAIALLNRSNSLRKLNRFGAAVNNYRDLATIFAKEVDPELRTFVASNLYTHGRRLTNDDKNYGNALQVYKILQEKFENDAHLKVRKAVVLGMNNAAVGYGLSNRPQDEMRANDALAQKFGDESDTEIRRVVAVSLSNASYERMLQAKQLLLQSKNASDLLSVAVKDSIKATQICTADANAVAQPGSGYEFFMDHTGPACSGAWDNLGYARFLQGNIAEAEAATVQAIKLGHKREVKDPITLDSIDRDYEALLDKLFATQR